MPIRILPTKQALEIEHTFLIRFYRYDTRRAGSQKR